MALLSRILSRHWSFRPLKFFHFGDTNFPLEDKTDSQRESGAFQKLNYETKSFQTGKPWDIPFIGEA